MVNGRPNIDNGNWVHGQVDLAPPSSTDPELVKAGSLYPYSKNVKIYKCPADKKMVGAAREPTTRSMSMSSWMNPIGTLYFGNGIARVYRKQGDLTRPTPVNCWVFIDESPGTINDGFFVCDPFGYPTTWVDIPAAYHGNAGGISFADGHAEIRKWRDPVVTKLNSPTFTPAQQNPPTDLRWLQDRSTSTK
jgi:prepilin-type processing-associated H-X9-DG protein